MKAWLPLVGVVVAQVVILLVFVLKQRADDRRRWHEKRIELYVSFIGEMTDRHVELERKRDAGSISGDEDWRSQANTERVKLLNHIALLSSSEVYVKALDWGIASKELIDAAVTGALVATVDSGGPDVRREFLDAVRKELGITSERPV